MEYTIETFFEKGCCDRAAVRRAGLLNRGLVGVGVSLGAVLAGRITSFAVGEPLGEDNVDNFVKALNDGTKSNGKLDNAQNKVVGIAGNTYTIFRSIGLILIMIAAIVAFVKLAGSSGQGQNDGKSGMVKVALALLALGALGSFVALCFDIGGTLFSS